MTDADLMAYFEPQSLRQEGPWDCGVEVFRKLAGVNREELLDALPDAINGVSASQAEAWLKTKGLIVEMHDEDEAYTLPLPTL
jgi:hypothetical protein